MRVANRASYIVAGLSWLLATIGWIKYNPGAPLLGILLQGLVFNVIGAAIAGGITYGIGYGIARLVYKIRGIRVGDVIAKAKQDNWQP
ncbi:MAG: hypothetical protein COW22_00240 [Chloroflexi bacterium CG15_BIG_FIL_POST_REV_8_21_14_020_46_15]|nr:MAG: hypothetical protein COW22_00240 [Chloroflexi bacterium CG15_BIG_FIL_POST_REV_8_21_14_020_46_15]